MYTQGQKLAENRNQESVIKMEISKRMGNEKCELLIESDCLIRIIRINTLDESTNIEF